MLKETKIEWTGGGREVSAVFDDIMAVTDAAESATSRFTVEPLITATDSNGKKVTMQSPGESPAADLGTFEMLVNAMLTIMDRTGLNDIPTAEFVFTVREYDGSN